VGVLVLGAEQGSLGIGFVIELLVSWDELLLRVRCALSGEGVPLLGTEWLELLVHLGCLGK